MLGCELVGAIFAGSIELEAEESVGSGLAAIGCSEFPFARTSMAFAGTEGGFAPEYVGSGVAPKSRLKNLLFTLKYLFLLSPTTTMKNSWLGSYERSRSTSATLNTAPADACVNDRKALFNSTSS